jgi:hypothetical protein
MNLKDYCISAEIKVNDKHISHLSFAIMLDETNIDAYAGYDANCSLVILVPT